MLIAFVKIGYSAIGISIMLYFGWRAIQDYKERFPDEEEH